MTQCNTAAVTTDMLEPDQRQAIEHLMLLDEEAECFTFQTFDDNSDRDSRRLTSVRHGSITDPNLWAELVRLNQAGAGVFVTVNETNGKGREGSDITRIRALWQEDDGDGKPLPVEPHIVIQSSPGKYHRYLLVDGLEVDAFEPLQRVLVETYGSDPKAKDRSRVLRLAGFFHQKVDSRKGLDGTPRMVRVLEHSGALPYSRDAILKAFPPKPKEDPPRQKEQTERGLWVSPETVTDLRSALNHLRADDRELWVAVGHALKELGDTGRGLWLDWSASSPIHDPAKDPQQWETFKPSRTGHQSVFSKAQAAGWVNPRSNAAAGGVPLCTWPELADPFAEHAAPCFPLGCLPDAFAKFSTQYSKQTGFDAGAYAFNALIAAANIIDHRSRLAVTESFRVPPNLWGGLVDVSGGGKSPTIGAATRAAHAINNEVVEQSLDAYTQWQAECQLLPKAEHPQKPAWRQCIANDTTVEALADLLKDNPEGIAIIADELTEFVGRMDAYSKSSKDRAIYLRAFDGGPQTINRKSSGHQHVENFSVGILAGIQPAKLAELVKRDGADGLYQRFLFYSMQPPAMADYGARIGPLVDVNMHNLFAALSTTRINAALSSTARAEMNDYHNAIRTLAMRTPGQRLAEHLSKFPGFIGRIALVLHALESAVSSTEASKPVSLETWQRAKTIMACLLRHSEAIYALLDEKAADALALVKSAAEAILAKGWERFKRGDLTRHATGWRGASLPLADGAIDVLIELGWIKDVTIQDQKKRGRPSDGTFLVNPAVGVSFASHAERISLARQERHAAILAVSDARSGEVNQ